VSDGRVLIVGAGVAGFAMARALLAKRIRFLLVDCLAQPPQPRLGLNLPGNAVHALRMLDIELGGVGVPIRRREYRTATGRLLFAVDESAFWAPAATSVCVRRADLLTALADGIPADAVRWGTEVTSLTTGPGGVDVSFADAHQESFDLVVGADGVHSTVRAVLFGGSAPRAALLSQASWRFTADNLGVECWIVWSGAAGTFLLIPVGPGEVYGYASATRGGSVSDDPQWLRSVFAEYPDPVPRTVDAVLASRSTLYHSPVEEVRIPQWNRDRVVLIGDAAHATAPVWAQGAALAAEDALVLGELLDELGDWSVAGDQFEQRRRPRVEHVQAMTDKLSRAARLPVWLRDGLLPIVGPRTYRETYRPLRDPVL
jgi:2-polyprenyl-6-methoxyphenol hydroxylase-like FAD-dependent oxidoreductase